MRESQKEDNLTWITQFIDSEWGMGIFVKRNMTDTAF